MSPGRDVRLQMSERLVTSHQASTSMSLPVAVHRRLDLLVDAADVVNASRAEIIAMLIAQAGIESGTLVEQMIRYRTLTVGEVLHGPVAGTSDADTVVVPLRGPGRPARGQSAR